MLHKTWVWSKCEIKLIQIKKEETLIGSFYNGVQWFEWALALSCLVLCVCVFFLVIVIAMATTICWVAQFETETLLFLILFERIALEILFEI